jgi:hypothetical protein
MTGLVARRRSTFERSAGMPRVAGKRNALWRTLSFCHLLAAPVQGVYLPGQQVADAWKDSRLTPPFAKSRPDPKSDLPGVAPRNSAGSCACL